MVKRVLESMVTHSPVTACHAGRCGRATRAGPTDSLRGWPRQRGPDLRQVGRATPGTSATPRPARVALVYTAAVWRWRPQ